MREALRAVSGGEEPASEEVDAEVVRVLGRIQEDRRKAKERSEKRKKERAAKEERYRAPRDQRSAPPPFP